jgi:type I restriction enzyme S subunit
LPPAYEQAAIVQFLSDRVAKIDNLANKSADVIGILREYRSALITDAVTGRIDVREAVA